ncbi:MAG: hypothetical protein C4522_08695, partial [Desulfobacteraceae bacterium]
MEKLFYWDKIRINSKSHFYLSESTQSELKNHCISFKLSEASQKAKLNGGFTYRLEICGADKKFFEALLRYEGYLRPYFISYVELAKEIFSPVKTGELYRACSSIESSIKKDYALLNKKWSSGSKLYEVGQHTKARRIQDKTLIGGTTAYFYGKKFKHTRYARLSKINGQLCDHSEHRILGAGEIKKKLGLQSISDFIDYDLETAYESLYARYFEQVKIDDIKLGKWLDASSSWKINTDADLRRVKSKAAFFKRIERIRSFSDLKKVFLKMQNDIKKSLSEKYRSLSVW